MSLETIIKNRVSQKGYTDQEVSRELVLELLDIAVYAPNHKMRQPWRFIVIDGQGKNKLRHQYLSRLDGDHKEKASVAFDKMSKAPMLIAFLMPTSLDFDVEFEDIQANASVVQNFLLLAEEAGLSTHWKTPGFIKTDGFKEILGVKEKELVAGIIMIGYADEKANSKPRFSAQTLTSYYES